MNLLFKADYYTQNAGRCRKGEVHDIVNKQEIDLLLRIGMAIPHESPKTAKEKVMAINTGESKKEVVTKEEKVVVQTKGKRGRPFKQ